MDKDTKKHLNDEIFCALLSAFSEHFSPRHARLFLPSWQPVLPTAMTCSSPYGRKAGVRRPWYARVAAAGRVV